MKIDTNDLLERGGLKKRDFAEIVGLRPQTIYNWGQAWPLWAVRFLMLLISSGEGLPDVSIKDELMMLTEPSPDA